ncbi:MAG TPA: GNAT family N-acetyltransferase [Symbiobacteriaceae bacterium]|nr:GNAT family N-acetyltransferase [Symbiobacteriaceae bacterium]
MSESIAFRRLTTADLPLMHRWVNTEPLIQIWNHGKTKTYDEVAAKYQPRIDGTAPTDPYLILCDGTPIGYIQNYLWRDYPDDAEPLKLKEEAGSLDVFIGEEAYRGRGLGPKLLVKFMRDIVFRNEAVASCVIIVEDGNERAVKAYEKAGFKNLGPVDHPLEPTPVIIMRAGRDELPSE